MLPVPVDVEPEPVVLGVPAVDGVVASRCRAVAVSDVAVCRRSPVSRPSRAAPVVRAGGLDAVQLVDAAGRLACRWLAVATVPVAEPAVR